jgi:hypothetical protein
MLRALLKALGDWYLRVVKTRPRTPVSRHRRAKLQVEPLEDLICPSSYLFIGQQGGNPNWSTPVDWVNMANGTTVAAPVNGDTVNISPGTQVRNPATGAVYTGTNVSSTDDNVLVQPELEDGLIRVSESG